MAKPLGCIRTLLEAQAYAEAAVADAKKVCPKAAYYYAEALTTINGWYKQYGLNTDGSYTKWAVLSLFQINQSCSNEAGKTVPKSIPACQSSSSTTVIFEEEEDDTTTQTNASPSPSASGNGWLWLLGIIVIGSLALAGKKKKKSTEAAN